MFIDLSKVGIYVVPGFTDMRKQINGLSSLLYDIIDIDLQQPNIFIFCGKIKKHLKILYWEINGFCLWQKKLGKIFYLLVAQRMHAMCFYYSLIETAKLNRINPHTYLKWVFETAPLLKDTESIENLAPWNIKPENINKIMLPGNSTRSFAAS